MEAAFGQESPLLLETYFPNPLLKLFSGFVIYLNDLAVSMKETVGFNFPIILC